MASYGSYGYGVSKPRVPKPVATSPYTNYGGLSPYSAQPVPHAAAQTPLQPATAGRIPQPGRPMFDTGDSQPIRALSTPGINAGIPGVSQPTVAAAPAPANVYDINTDPALQAISALTGKSDADAQAAALQQEQGQLLGYGDPALALATLNDPTIAQAAAANPTSTVAQLGTSRDRNVHDLTENLNKQNLFYGGYRVTQEQQAAQDYQNALANAAAAVQGNLSTIQGNLAQALSTNQAQRIAAMQNAYANAPQQAATPTDLSGAYPSGAITSDMVAAPQYQPGGAPNPYSSTNAIADPNLASIASALYGRARGGPILA